MIKKQREKQYAVFGLGRFGTSVALTLNELGYQVMGVDTVKIMFSVWHMS